MPLGAELLSERLSYICVWLPGDRLAISDFVGYRRGSQLSQTTADGPCKPACAEQLSGTGTSSVVRYGAPASLLLIDVDGLKK
jgi:hypothetical protein